MSQKCRNKDATYKTTSSYLYSKYERTTSMKNDLLGKRVKELRGKNGFSQEFLAEECKVSLRTIQRGRKWCHHSSRLYTLQIGKGIACWS
jgi:DNA-binding transcriptional regulator YiaG